MILENALFPLIYLGIAPLHEHLAINLFASRIAACFCIPPSELD